MLKLIIVENVPVILLAALKVCSHGCDPISQRQNSLFPLGILSLINITRFTRACPFNSTPEFALKFSFMVNFLYRDNHLCQYLKKKIVYQTFLILSKGKRPLSKNASTKFFMSSKYLSLPLPSGTFSSNPNTGTSNTSNSIKILLILVIQVFKPDDAMLIFREGINQNFEMVCTRKIPSHGQHYCNNLDFNFTAMWI